MQSGTMFNHDKRFHERVDCRTEAVVEWEGRVFSGEVENLSLKGLFVRTDTVIPIDSVVRVTVRFTGDSSRMSFSLDARVVRVDERGVGLNFRRIDVNSLLVQKMNSIESDSPVEADGRHSA